MDTEQVKSEIAGLIVQLRNRISRAKHSKVTPEEVKLLTHILNLTKAYTKLEKVSRMRHEGPGAADDEDTGWGEAMRSGEFPDSYSSIFGDLRDFDEFGQEQHPNLSSSNKPRLRIVD